MLVVVGVLVCFARQMYSTTKFATTVLSKCVAHAGFVKVARTLRGIYIFNLVIRLSKVKQTAFFHGFTCRSLSC